MKQLEQAARELLRLKDIKATLDMGAATIDGFAKLAELRGEYERCKEPAWDALRAALAQPQESKRCGMCGKPWDDAHAAGRCASHPNAAPGDARPPAREPESVAASLRQAAMSADSGYAVDTELLADAADVIDRLLDAATVSAPDGERREPDNVPIIQMHYGQDCPVGKVQIEFVGCPPSARYSNYGWKPVDHAFIEAWVDGKRYRIEVGTFHDGRGERRGLHVIGPLGMVAEQTAMNAASLHLAAAQAEPPHGEGEAMREIDVHELAKQVVSEYGMHLAEVLSRNDEYNAGNLIALLEIFAGKLDAARASAQEPKP